ncbi:glycogen debranching protein [Stackebrandtia nassauensis]|uniref:Alpha amylase catalytic region n=1 Tax=Stackebrandtia nassauensis (strain DSM 44728 / CIP 108903 / NRRL B-16338 / NBRC 102104 / LLR-40K-21) TaxID=446470 RepID=D3QB22_STANL|nr:isoamylase [Stackebrandtia nassauensis]ADD40839.1 alpha amylase catalytic region [Stackebrandtia nassauensis DSM 44728]
MSAKPRLITTLAACLVTAAGLLVASSAQAEAAPPLGAHYDDSGQNITFAVHSAAATRMDVYLYAKAEGADENLKVSLTEASDVYSGSVSVADLNEAGITGDVYYGYRAWGPNWTFDESWKPGSEAGFGSDVDADGNRFNPNKLLLDPYTTEVSHDPLRDGMTDEGVYASGPEHRVKDSGKVAPKGIVLADAGGDTGSAPTRPLKDDVVYEVHLRGLTKNDPDVPEGERGTYAGAARKAAELAELGVTAVEFLPLAEGPNDQNDATADSTEGDNYWGYQSLNFFAPDRRYASNKSPGGPTAEFKRMVKAFHDAGLKVFVDVVYNHTGEGYAWESGDKNTYNLLSYRGLDNPSYYSLTADKQGSWDNTGVGGNFNTFNPAAKGVIVDSLRYWRETLGVDGFRHDLASVLGNTCQHGCFKYERDNPDTALNAITDAMPARPADGGAGTDWIAEPWAIGDGTYQVGNFPKGWSEWNDKYRDTWRADQNKLGVEKVTPGQLATRIAGSSDLYGDDGRKPSASVNFTVAHDGFTLKDLYSCNDKDNGQSWPYGPSDGGSDNNLSWDHGGDAAAQRQAARTGMASLLTSAGTPMMTGGDEHLRSVRCNNNPYNLDSEANWLNHSPDADQSAFGDFTAGMLDFRSAHPALRPDDFYSGSDGNGNGMADLDWFTPAGAKPDAGYFDSADNHALGWRLDGTEFGDPYDAIYIGYNGWSGKVDFTLPDPPQGKTWHRVTDTASFAEGPGQVAKPGSEEKLDGATYGVNGRSMVVLIAK